jgi:hypothetical protein
MASCHQLAKDTIILEGHHSVLSDGEVYSGHCEWANNPPLHGSRFYNRHWLSALVSAIWTHCNAIVVILHGLSKMFLQALRRLSTLQAINAIFKQTPLIIATPCSNCRYCCQSSPKVFIACDEYCDGMVVSKNWIGSPILKRITLMSNHWPA